MFFLNEQQKKINDLYTQLQNQKEAKRILEGAMHSSFYDRENYHKLYVKLKKLREQIKATKEELDKERKSYEKSRKSV